MLLLSCFAAIISITYSPYFLLPLFCPGLSTADGNNQTGEVTWHQAINQFSDVTAEEFRDSHGWVSSRGLEAKGTLSYMEDPDFHVPADFDLKSLPKDVDWRSKGVVSPIKNQGMCGEL